MANELLPPKVTPHKATASVHKPVLPFRIFCVFREIIALTVWLYAIVNLFVFDLDNYLVMHLAPDYAWLVNFKFVVFLAGILIFALFTRKGALLLFAGYVIAYPFILILARFPYFVYKQKSWTLFFHVVNLVVSGFRSIKYAAVSFSLYIICYTIVLAAQNKWLLYFSGTVLFILILVSYGRQTIRSLKKGQPFQSIQPGRFLGREQST